MDVFITAYTATEGFNFRSEKKSIFFFNKTSYLPKHDWALALLINSASESG